MMNLNYNYELIESPKIIAQLGITESPAMIVNNKIVIHGWVPNILEMIEILKDSL